MEQWKYMDFETLIEKVLSGDENIQEPFTLHNKMGDHVTKQSFINYLMNYENIHKENFLEVLNDIFDIFQQKIYQLHSNPNINRMIIRVNNEWMKPEREFTFINKLPDDLFQQKNDIDKHYHQSCDVCNNTENTCNSLRVSPIDDLTNSNNVDREADWGLKLCNELSDKIKSTMENVKTYIDQSKSYDLSLLIDLAIKHKSLYLKLNEHEDNGDEMIPDNIHTIFSNFVYIFNLFHKQLIQYHHTLELLLEDLHQNCSKMKSIKKNFGMVAHIDLKNLLGNKKHNLEPIEGELIKKEHQKKTMDEYPLLQNSVNKGEQEYPSYGEDDEGDYVEDDYVEDDYEGDYVGDDDDDDEDEDDDVEEDDKNDLIKHLTSEKKQLSFF
jgi:hypothetical protein